MQSQSECGVELRTSSGPSLCRLLIRSKYWRKCSVRGVEGLFCPGSGGSVFCPGSGGSVFCPGSRGSDLSRQWENLFCPGRGGSVFCPGSGRICSVQAVGDLFCPGSGGSVLSRRWGICSVQRSLGQSMLWLLPLIWSDMKGSASGDAFPGLGCGITA